MPAPGPYEFSDVGHPLQRPLLVLCPLRLLLLLDRGLAAMTWRVRSLAPRSRAIWARRRGKRLSSNVTPRRARSGGLLGRVARRRGTSGQPACRCASSGPADGAAWRLGVRRFASRLQPTARLRHASGPLEAASKRPTGRIRPAAAQIARLLAFQRVGAAPEHPAPTRPAGRGAYGG